MATESSAALELPSFADRLPDLVVALKSTGQDLIAAQPKQSYLPYWEDLYTAAHGMKGVLKILACPMGISEYVVQLTETLLRGLAGTGVCRRLGEAGTLFREMADVLDVGDPKKIDSSVLLGHLRTLHALYGDDLDHELRLKEVPPRLFYVNEFVSKKAREIMLLNLNHCVVEDEILLDEIPLWRTQLSESLVSPEFGRGLLVNFLPFLSPEGSRRLKVWAWIAAASHSRAALKQRVKEVMPKVAIGKI